MRHQSPSSHTEDCLSANRFGDGFDCLCPTAVTKVPEPAERSAELLLADLAQIAFTECQDPRHALERIRGLLDPHRATLLPLGERIEALCKKGWQQGDDEVCAFVTELREELRR